MLQIIAALATELPPDIHDVIPENCSMSVFANITGLSIRSLKFFPLSFKSTIKFLRKVLQQYLGLRCET